MSKDWQFPGSRWWKCDLHLHTPASYDFKNRETITPEEWVSAALSQGLEIVAVTDHNTGKFIPKALQAADGQSLYVFPGVEVTVNGGVHLLTLFDVVRGEDAVTGLLALCGIPGEQMGKPEACASCAFEQALAHGAAGHGVNIAAHVDDEDGLLKIVRPGQTLQKIVSSEFLHAAEVKLQDQSLLAFLDNSKSGYERALGPLPQVTFSDAHALDQIGRSYTWIKMTRPSIEGLRLALEDGALSVKPCTTQPENPNTHASLLIESIKVEDARYMGRGAPLQVCFNPWLNSIVGGRGTGKSSLLELLRIALRRESELPEALRRDFEAFKRVAQGRQDLGFLLERTRVRVIYRKDGARFRVQWSHTGDLPAIEAEAADGTWHPDPGDVKGRFPVRIFSQRQIFEIAREPGALLSIVDDSSTVDRRSWQSRWEQEERRFLALRAKLREIQARLADQERIEGDLRDVLRKLQVFETAGHAEALRQFQRRRRQERALESWDEGLRQTRERLSALASAVSRPILETGLFDPSDEADASLLRLAESTADRIQAIGLELEEAAGELDLLLNRWHQGRTEWAGAESVRRSFQEYDLLLERLRGENMPDPSEYGRLVQSRHALEQRLADLSDQRKALVEVDAQSRESLERLRALRQELTSRRKRFLAEVVGANLHVRIEVVPFGDETRARGELPALLQTQRFQNDFEELLSKLYPGGKPHDPGSGGFLQQLDDLKMELAGLGRGELSPLQLQDKRFAGHLTSLKPETFDRLLAWFPEDSLKVTYSRRGIGTDFVPLDQGSPGQKAAAILAFLLSYGEEPMVLDQPEDDLDNHLISDLVVQQLRENKARRQVIVVTHNPNIVVNADAELVVVLESRGGQAWAAQSGGLQDQKVRDEVCRVMEGGREALERRYRRIGRRSGNV